MGPELQQNIREEIDVIKQIMEQSRPTLKGLHKPFLLAACLSAGFYILSVSLDFIQWLTSLGGFTYGTYSINLGSLRIELYALCVAVFLFLYAYRLRNRASRDGVHLLCLWGAGFLTLFLLQLLYELRYRAYPQIRIEVGAQDPVYGFHLAILPYLSLLAAMTLAYAASFRLLPKGAVLGLLTGNLILTILALFLFPTMTIFIISPYRDMAGVLLYMLGINAIFLLPALNLMAMGLLIRRQEKRG